jgi:O-antigen ligase
MIEVFVETGVIGFAAMVGTLVLLVWGTVRSARRDGAAGAALLALLAAFFLISSVSSSFWAFWWQATFVLLASPMVAALAPGNLSAGFGPARRQA